MTDQSDSGPSAEQPLPSDAELKVLRQLWLHGESTVGEVHERVSADWPVGYTTILKLLQRMLDKGLVTRDDSTRAHRYAAASSEQRTQQRIARDLAARAFGGSIDRLVQAALPGGKARERELARIRAMLDELD